MIHLLIMIALLLAAYLFHNYQTFHETYIRPWIVEQVNFNREANPQALCDLLAPDVVVNIKDQYTRYRYDITNGNKKDACDYFLESARHFKKPQKEKNGYIWDRLVDFSIDQENLLRDFATITFSTNVRKDTPRDLITVEGDALIGKTTTKITVKSPVFKDSKITNYTFNRKLVQILSENR